MEEKIYYCAGEKGFWIARRYIGRLVAFKEWPESDTEPVVIAEADTVSELERKLGDRYWVRSGSSMFSRPICRIVKKAPK